MKKTLLTACSLLLVAVAGMLFIPTFSGESKARTSVTRSDPASVESFIFAAPLEPFAITGGADNNVRHLASGEDDSQDPVILLAAGTVLILVCSLATFNQQRIKRLREEKVDGEERK